MSTLVGVHGIAKEQMGRHQLQGPWALALADGLERAAERRVGVPPLNVAFYGDLFMPPTPGTGKKGFDLGDTIEWEALTAADLDEAVSAASEILTEQELTVAAEDTAKGFGQVPRPVAAVVAALDRRFGARAGALFIGELSQVRRYLLDPKLKGKVDARVAEAVTDDCQVLIGHSLGSVVAFEFLRQHPHRNLKLFMTLGCPLGLRAIQHHLPDPSFGSEGIPPNVGVWVNLRDPHDPVACAGSLTRWWPAVREGLVDNQRAAHSAERYLSKKQTGDAVLTVLPELAP